MTLIKQCFPVVGFVFLKKVVQAFEIVGEILKKKITKAVPAVLRLWVQSRKKETKEVFSVLWYMFESVDEIINKSLNLCSNNSMLLCRFGTSLFCQLKTIQKSQKRWS